MKLLVVTNDFPPWVGGIEDYVAQLLLHLPTPISAVVLAPGHLAAPAVDATFPHRVVRWPGFPMLPTPRLVRAVFDLMRLERPDVLVFGAALPLALMNGLVRRRFQIPIIAFTHGVEPTTAAVPGGGLLLRAIARQSSLLTAVSAWAERRLREAVGPEPRIAQLPSGVDAQRFRPDVSGEAVRQRYGFGGAPVVVCLSRLVRRKGHDQVIRAMKSLALEFPDIRLLIVGEGPDKGRLERIAHREGVRTRVVFTGGVAYEELPAHFAAGDLFAMPCRSRFGGLENEGLGAVFLQAAAVGRPAIAGDSGGAPEAVRHGETGLVVDGRHVADVERAIGRLLRHPDEARALGAAAAARVHREMTWALMGERLGGLIQEVASGRT